MGKQRCLYLYTSGRAGYHGSARRSVARTVRHVGLFEPQAIASQRDRETSPAGFVGGTELGECAGVARSAAWVLSAGATSRDLNSLRTLCTTRCR
jgi:hypothetical protein